VYELDKARALHLLHIWGAVCLQTPALRGSESRRMVQTGCYPQSHLFHSFLQELSH